jgi:hypothetical protein
MGQSGYKLCAQKPTVRFLAVVVMHDAAPTKSGGIAGTYVQVKTTYACVNGTKTPWPQQLPGNDGSWHRWYDVPVNTPIPDTNNHRACIHTPPATAPRPSDAALTKASSSSLKGSWRQAASKYNVGKVLAQLQQYHSGGHVWADVTSHELKGSATSTHFTNLSHGGKYRLRVSFKNRIGWSKASGWVQRALS